MRCCRRSTDGRPSPSRVMISPSSTAWGPGSRTGSAFSSGYWSVTSTPVWDSSRMLPLPGRWAMTRTPFQSVSYAYSASLSSPGAGPITANIGASATSTLPACARQPAPATRPVVSIPVSNSSGLRGTRRDHDQSTRQRPSPHARRTAVSPAGTQCRRYSRSSTAGSGMPRRHGRDGVPRSVHSAGHHLAGQPQQPRLARCLP